MYFLGVLLLVTAAVAIPVPEELQIHFPSTTPVPELKPGDEKNIDDEEEDESSDIPDYSELSLSPVSFKTIIDELKKLVPGEIKPEQPKPDKNPDKEENDVGTDTKPNSEEDKPSDKGEDNVDIIKLDLKNPPSLSEILSLLPFSTPSLDLSVHKPSIINHPKSRRYYIFNDDFNFADYFH